MSQPRTDEEGFELDSNGLPVIRRVGAKLATLERMADYLEGKIEDGRANDFNRAELKALKAAIVALKHHWAEVEGRDTLTLAADALVVQAEAAIAEFENAAGPDLPIFNPLREAMERVRVLLKAIEQGKETEL